MSNKVIFPGSFDPVTNGHLWMIEQLCSLFDEVIVAIGDNPEKRDRSMFNIQEKVSLLEKSVAHLPKVKISVYQDLYLVDYAKSLGISHIARGIRNERDFSEERDFRHCNAKLHSKIQTLFMIPPKELSEVSSSMIKQMLGYYGWELAIRDFVPEPVYKKLLHRFAFPAFQEAWRRFDMLPETEQNPESKLPFPIPNKMSISSAEKALENLIDRYLEPHRHYHTISHIFDCLFQLKKLPLSFEDRDKLVLALWFHDAIYDTHAADNEQKSADLLNQLMGESKLQKSAVKTVQDLVMATKTHVGNNELENYMLDIDLSILGRNPEVFQNYDEAIRKEYHWVQESVYQTERHKIMRAFYLRPQIFKTKHFSELYENQAKTNLSQFK